MLTPIQSAAVRERASHVPEIHLSCGAMVKAGVCPWEGWGGREWEGVSHTDTPEVSLVVPPQLG